MDGPAHYEIHVSEHIDERWSEWFGGLEVVYAESGGTTLRGEMLDQPALFGVLGTVRDLGLTLVSVQRTPVVSLPAGATVDSLAPEAPGNPDNANNEGR